MGPLLRLVNFRQGSCLALLAPSPDRPFGLIDVPPKMAKGSSRSEIRPGLTVDIILKADQRTGKKTRGVVRDILTNSANHPHGIKVRLADGQVGRVCDIPAQP
jgi:uncharacterized repeat protein (TIGR03833 family)